MNRKLFTAVALMAGPVLWVPGAQAGQITFGPSAQSITYTGLVGNVLGVSSPILTGPALFNGVPVELGNFSISAMSFTATLTGPGLYTPSANTETFTYTSTSDSDTLTETIHWTRIQDDTDQPKFFGTGTVISSSGDADFLSQWAVGTVDLIDFLSMPLACTPASNCVTLDVLASTVGATATARISSGEKLPQPAPEPASLTLLGSALLGLGMLARRRHKTL